MCAVVSTALHHSRRLHARDLSKKVAPFEADTLGPKMARSVIGDCVAGGALELGIEALFFAKGPYELTRVGDGFSEGDNRRFWSNLAEFAKAPP